MKIAYNQTEADKNILLSNASAEASIDTTQNNSQIPIDTAKEITAQPRAFQDTVKTTSDSIKKSNNFWDDFSIGTIMPTKTSLSGIGSVFYFKNLTGQIAIGISLLISLILFALFRFLKSKKTQLYLLLTAAVCLTIFIIDSFISSVTLLWGSWTLFAIVLFQLLFEYRERNKAYR